MPTMRLRHSSNSLSEQRESSIDADKIADILIKTPIDSLSESIILLSKESIERIYTADIDNLEKIYKYDKINIILNNINYLLNNLYVNSDKEIESLDKLIDFINAGFVLKNKFTNQLHNFNHTVDISSELSQRSFEIVLKYHDLILLNQDNTRIKNPKIQDLTKNIYKLLVSADSIEANGVLDFILSNLEMYKENKENPFIHGMTSIQQLLSSSHRNGGVYFTNNQDSSKINATVQTLVDILNDINNSDSIYYTNFIYELGRFIRYDSQKNKVLDTFKKLITRFNRDERALLKIAQSLIDTEYLNKKNCLEFLDKNNKNICDLKTEIAKKLFPHRHSYENGKIVIYSSLSEDRSIEIYNSMKNVKASYKSALEIENKKPIENNNERLQIYDFSSLEDYMNFKPLVSDLSNNEDGGIFIPSINTFYTYNGEPGQLARFLHELIHALNYKYLKGMPVLEEGSAEFFAGADELNGFIDREDIIKSISLKDLRPIKEIIRATHETASPDVIYHQGYVLFSYIYNKHHSLLLELVNAKKSDDTEFIKHFIKEISKYDKEFFEYVKQKIQGNTLKYITPASKLNLENQVDLANIVSTLSSNDLSNFSCNFNDYTHFNSNKINIIGSIKCTGAINAKSSQETQKELANFLDKIHKLGSPYSHTYCYYGAVVDSRRKISCNIPSKNVDFDLLTEDLKEKIKSFIKKQSEINFKNNKNQYFMFTGNTLFGEFFESQRRIEAKLYNTVALETPEIGNTEIENGEIHHFRSDDNYDTVTGKVKIENKDKNFYPTDDSFEKKYTVLRFKNNDIRFFQNRIELSKENTSAGELYKNEYSREEIDGFYKFNDDFSYNSVRKFSFEIEKLPQNAEMILHPDGRYSYRNLKKEIGKDDIVKIAVLKEGKKVLTLDIKFIDNLSVDKKLIAKELPIIPTEVKLSYKKINDYIEVSVKKETDYDKYVFKESMKNDPEYSNYSYTLVKDAKPNALRSANYGAFSYDLSIEDNKNFDFKNFKDSARFLVTKIINGEKPEDLYYIDLNFIIE